MAVWKITFVSEHSHTGQSQLTKCFALVACFACCSLGSSSWRRYPSKSWKERKTHSRLTLSCVLGLSNMHTIALIQMRDVFKTPLFKEISWLLVRNSLMTFFK